MSDWKRIRSTLGMETWQKNIQDGRLTVLISVDQGMHHISISHPKRNPRWDEIKEARYKFCPDNITMAILLPPSAEYINIHETTFHLWQTP